MQDLRVSRGEIALAGSYSPGGDNAVLALHGAGHGTRDFLLYEHLHRLLPPAGIGVVTFDRRGEGDSTGDSSRGRFQVQAEDALAVRQALDVERVGLWGFSQGGWIAPLAASQSDGRRLRRRCRLDGRDALGADDVRDGAAAPSGRLRRGRGRPRARPAPPLRGFHPRPSGGRGSAPRGSARRARRGVVRTAMAPADDRSTRRASACGSRRWTSTREPIFAQVRVPALLFFGGRDSWSPIPESVETWRRAKRGRRGRRHPRGRARHDPRGWDDLARVRAQAGRLARRALAR